MFERMGFMLLVSYEKVEGENVSAFFENEVMAAQAVTALNDLSPGPLGRQSYRYIHARVSELDDDGIADSDFVPSPYQVPYSSPDPLNDYPPLT